VPYTVSITPTAGDFLVVFVWQIEGAATPSAMTDNRSDVYTKDCEVTYDQGFGGNRRLTVYHLLNAPSGITGIKITPNQPSRGIVAEYTGVPSGAVLDVCGTVSNQSTATTSFSSTAATTTASDLVFGLADTGTTGNAGYSASGGWTGRAAQHDTIDLDDSYFEDRINVAAGSYTATGTTSTAVRESSLVVAYRIPSNLIPPTITSSSSAIFTVGTPGSFTVTATGTPTPTLTESGTLPSGISFNAATGALSGTPAAGTAGSYPITFTAQNGVTPNATQSFTLTVGQPPTITSTSSTTFTAGAAGSFTVTATGTPTPALSESGTLPSGVSFNAATGVLSGTPAAGTGGTYPITFTAQNGATPNATQSFTLTVNEAPTITSTSGTVFTVGTAGSFTLTATGTPTPTLSESGTLPSGVSFNAATGVLSGTPAAGTGGTYPITFTAQNGVTPNATQSFTLTVGQPPTITSTNSTTFTAGSAGSFTVTATGIPVPTLSESGTLPSGVSFNAATGVLSGTPAAGTDGSYSITFTAQNGATPNATQSFTLTVNQAPTITNTSSTVFTAGTPGSFTVTATGTPAPTLSESGTLPSGVSFNAATGVLSGTPAAGPGGTYPITFTAQNGVAPNATQSFTLIVQTASTAFVRSAGNSGEAVPYTVSIAPTAGNFLVVFVWQIEGSATPSVMTDNRSDVYTMDCDVTYNQGFGPNRRLTVYHLLSAPGGITGINITPNAPSRGIVAEYSGVPNGTVLDACAAESDQSTATTTFSSTAATTSASGLVFGLADTGTTGTAGYSASGGWTGRAAQHDTIDMDDSYFEERINAAAGSYTATGTTSTAARESSLVVAYKLIQNLIPPTFTSSSSTTFAVGAAGTFTVAAIGIPPPALSESGTLPSGLSFNAATGVLSGTPAAGTSGTYPISFTAQNGVAPNATQSFVLTVNQTPSIISLNSTSFTVGAAGSFTVAATGTPTPTLSESGTLPSGVTFNVATGLLSGTPAPGMGGTYPISFTAQNGVTPTATQSFTLTVNQAPAITSTSSTLFTVGTAGTFTVMATGTPAPSPSESGTLPSGVIFNAATGVLSGTPAAGIAGSYPITFTAQNGVAPNATQSFTLTVGQPPTITSSSGTTFTAGSAGSFTVTATGTPTPTLSESGTLPSGVSFNTGAGVLSGTPAAGTGGAYPITFTAQNGATPNATQSFTLTVNEAPTITSTNSTMFPVGTAGSFSITATGTPAPTLSESGTLPSGVSFNAATGVLSGTPAAGTGGTYSITFTAQNGVAPNATQGFTLTVAQPPTITNSSSTTFTAGSAGSFTVMATGIPVPTLSESGTVPSGVSFNAATGVLSGTPAAGTGGIYPITFTAQNGATPNATQSFTLTVNQAPTITSISGTAFTAGTPGNFTVTATGTPVPTLSEGGTLPSGVSFNAATGVLSGTPAAGTGGAYAITFSAQNGVTPNATQSFTLTVAQPPTITSSGSTTFTAGSAGSFTVTATGTPIPTLSESGTLPSGVSFNAATGVLSGTPAAGTGGIYSITFTAQNGAAPNATQSFTLTVNQAPTITSANTGVFTAGGPGTFVVTATGMPTPSLSESGTLPAGLTFNAATGVLSGIPASGTSGIYLLTFTAQNGVSPNATQNFTLTVQAAATTFVRSAGNSGEAVPYTVSIAPAAGDFLAVFVWQIEGSATPSVMTDNRSDVYTKDCDVTYDQGFGPNRRLTVYHLLSAPSGITGINITPNDPSRTIVAEYSGVPNGTVLDVCGAASNQSTATTSFSSTATTTSASGLVFGLADTGTAGNAGFSAGAGWTGRATQHDTIDMDDSYFEDRINVAAGSYTATGTTSTSVRESSLVVAYKFPPLVPPNITSTGSAVFTAGTAGSFTVTATGNPTPLVTETGTLPLGVTLNTSTGVLSGTPAAGTGGTYPIIFTALNGIAPNATQSFVLTVNQAPSITSLNSKSFTAGAAGSFTVTATGYPAPTLSESGPLPSGVVFNAATGVLSGTPAAGTAGTYTVAFTAQNGVAPNATQSFTLTVNQIPAITSISSIIFTAGTAGSFTVTATGSPAPALSESGALPSGVSFNAATAVLSGTPAAGTGGTYAITFTAQNGVAPNATQTFTLTVNQSPAITSINSGVFTVGAAGTFAVTATGTPAPALSQSGTLPSGVTFNAATGMLSGTPSAGTGGTYPITFTAQNGVAPATTQSFTLTVNQAPAITSSNSASFAVALTGTFSVTTTGFPVPTLSESGNLPQGVSFDPATGTLAGLPAANTGGVYPITFAAQNGVTPSATQSFVLTVTQSPTITSSTGTVLTVGTAGAFSVTATGMPAPTLNQSGTLPAGVSFNAATGVLSGTPMPRSGGSYPITFTAQNGLAPNATQSFVLTVNEAPAITSVTSASFTVGVGDSFSVTAAGYPAPILSENGTLPAGLTFNAATGALSGTPAAGTGASYPITFTAENGLTPSAAQSFTLNVGQAPVITSSRRKTFIVGTAGTFSVATTGFPAPNISETGALPAGITFNAPTGVFSGTAVAGAGGSYTINLLAQNGVTPDATQSLTLTVNQTAAITSANNVTFGVGIAASFAVTATGFPAPTLGEVGTLPAGITFNSSTGLFSGTPAAGTGGTYLITLTAHNGVASDATQSFALTVGMSAVITSANTVSFGTGALNSFVVTATGAPTPSLSETGALPPGIAFNSTTGMLSGTAADGTAGNYSIVFTAHNGIGADSLQNFTLVVVQGSLAPSINSSNSLTFIAGTPGSFFVTTSGSPTPSLSETGALPSGVVFNPSSGLLSGTAPAGTSGTYPITFTAQNGAGSDAVQAFTLTVNSAPAITVQPLSQSVVLGQTATFTVGATGSDPLTYQWRRNGAPIAGANSATYTTPVTTSADDGAQFTVAVGNSLGSILSVSAALAVNSVPSITSAPISPTIATGQIATFNVSISVTGNLPLTFQWSKNGANIPGANAASYQIPPAVLTDNGAQFAVVVANSLGSATASATLTVVALPSPATYYIDSSTGSDSSDGLAKNAPWQHAPGMTGCTDNCAITALRPGDRIVFKGGVTWDQTNFPMTVNTSGTNGHVITYGVDPTWFNGAAWSRPVFDLSNHLWSVAPVLVDGGDFVTFDNLEIRNATSAYAYWPATSSVTVFAGLNVTIQNSYIHGWKIQNPVSGSDQNPSGGIAFYWSTGMVSNSVLDGAPAGNSGVGIYGGTTIQNNVIENVPNGIVITDPAAVVSGNQVFNISDSVDPSVNSAAIVAYTSASIFDNVIHDLVPTAYGIYANTQFGVNPASSTQYIYNNLIWNVGNQPPFVTIADTTLNQLIYNNTMTGSPASGCIAVLPNYLSSVNLTVQNNHCISDLPASGAWCWNNAGGNFNCGTVANLVFGNNVLMPAATALSQGYTVANSFQPSSASGATVGAGINLVTNCVPIGAALCSDRVGVARPGGPAAWDVGTYQFQSVAPGLAPSITAQPSRQTAAAGQPATFSVIAAGTAPFTYQWLRNGIPISGATLSTYATPPTSLSDNGALFSVVVGNSVGSVASSPALLTVSATAGQLLISQSSINFGTVVLGTASTTTITLTNTSSSYVKIASVNVAGAGFNASNAPTGVILAPAEVATMNVAFAPSTVGSAGGSLAIASDAIGSPATVPLSGIGVQPAHLAILTWIASTSPVFGYDVYRSEQSGLPVRLNSSPVTVTQFTDVTVVPGHSYVYRVTAVDPFAVEGDVSNSALAIIPIP
jgi:large repetitive protein